MYSSRMESLAATTAANCRFNAPVEALVWKAATTKGVHHAITVTATVILPADDTPRQRPALPVLFIRIQALLYYDTATGADLCTLFEVLTPCWTPTKKSTGATIIV
jgi:hypothetical protein